MSIKYIEAYLMVEFDCKTKLPESIHVYGESENEITMIGNEYIRIASMDWKVCGDNKDVCGLEMLCIFLEKQLKQGVYDLCSFDYKGTKWTVGECKKICMTQ
jgi:hypothetical protein